MSVWSEYLARKLIFENHPLPDDSRCMNHMQTRHPCTACMEICPESVFTAPDGRKQEPDWELCSGCGLCVSACPARALTPSLLQTEKLLSVLSSCYNDITISCKTEHSSDLFMESPGSVPWEYLCCLALQGRVILVTGSCQTCRNTSCRQMLEKNLRLARSFFGGGPSPDNRPSLYASRILQTTDLSAIPPRRFSRREAIRQGLKRTGRTASALLPALDTSAPDGMLWHRLLMERMKQLTAADGKTEYETIFSLNLPSFTEKCTACSICSRMCPSRAILRAPGPEGAGRFYMALLPGKCTGCGLCAKICPEGGLVPPEPFPLEASMRPRLHAVAAVPCIRCQEPVPAGSGSPLCSRCRGESGH